MSKFLVDYEFSMGQTLEIEADNHVEAEEIAFEKLNEKHPDGGVFITEVREIA